MHSQTNHSRRDFLQGKAAAGTLADKLQIWVQNRLEAASAALADHVPVDPVWHQQASRRAMACLFEVQFHQADNSALAAALAALDLIQQIEAQLTIYRSDSEVLSINRVAADQPVRVEEGLFELLELSAQLHRDTCGAFDITSTPLSRVWGFLQRQGRMPDHAEIGAARALVDASQVVLDPQQQTVRFQRPGMEINFNSIGKGYALDRAAELLTSRGVADFLMQGGSSSVLACGSNRAETRGGWTVGLRHPLQPESYLAWLHLHDRALGTAGCDIQHFMHEGRRLGHIIDPRTGWPAEGLHSATVLAPTAAVADSLATAFYALGVEEAGRFCSNHPEVGALLVVPSPGDARIELHSMNLSPNDWTPATGIELQGSQISPV